MRIDAIELFLVSLPLRQPLATSWGPMPALNTVLLKMEGDGAVGWGEASPGSGPIPGPEWAAGTFACVRDWLAPRLVGSNVDSGKDLQEQLSAVRGNSFAKAALDTAWWDLQARQQAKPLHDLLGKSRDAIEIGASFDKMDSIDAFLAALHEAVDAGYSRIELKFRPGWDVPMVNHVRHELPVTRLHIDAEGALGLQHMEMLYRLDDFCLAMVEQPFAPDDLVAHAMAQESVRTPICLDESITSPQVAEIALDLKSGKYLNVKPGRVGGLTSALAIHDACHENCVPCWVGAMPQTAIGSRIGYALASKENFTYPADQFRGDLLLETDLAAAPEPVRGEDGVLRIPLWSEPGIGVEPDAPLLDKYSLTRARIEKSS
jgi:O-succinylbenzoate synthase